jgi:hypothetical protein
MERPVLYLCAGFCLSDIFRCYVYKGHNLCLYFVELEQFSSRHVIQGDYVDLRRKYIWRDKRCLVCETDLSLRM